jgi:hypothetical protein
VSELEVINGGLVEGESVVQMKKSHYDSLVNTYFERVLIPNCDPPVSGMKDHEFREQVNDLKRLCDTFKGTDQLRSQLALFLKQFKEKCE